jgi:pyruvate dehydrogenase E1 component
VAREACAPRAAGAAVGLWRNFARGASSRGNIAGEHTLDVEVWSVTSYSELQRNAIARVAESHVVRCLPGDVPVIAASDYVRAWPQLIAPHIEAPMHVLGTDGFGRSDSRRALRRFFRR